MNYAKPSLFVITELKNIYRSSIKLWDSVKWH